MRKCIREYLYAVLHWWWVVTIGVGAGAVTFAFNLLDSVVIPIWVWIVLAVLGLFVAQFLAFYKKRKQYEERVVTPEEVEETLTSLSELRTKGVALRNQGLTLQQSDEAKSWIQEVEHWRNLVKAKIGEISAAEASLFGTEDRVTPVEFHQPVNPKHGLYVGIITQDTEKIRELVQRLSPSNLAKKSGIEK